MNQENRKLPTVNLAGTEFYVDASQGMLIDTLNSSNHFHIYEMLRLDDHFEMVFDKKTRNLKEGNWTDISGERYEYIWLRPLGVYDPEGAKKCLTDEDLLFLKSLPGVDVEGVKFLWEEESGLLFQEGNPWNIIAKNDAVQRDTVMGFYFDKEKSLVPFPNEIPSDKAKLPPSITFVPLSEINLKIRKAQQQKVGKALLQSRSRKLK